MFSSNYTIVFFPSSSVSTEKKTRFMLHWGDGNNLMLVIRKKTFSYKYTIIHREYFVYTLDIDVAFRQCKYCHISIIACAEARTTNLWITKWALRALRQFTRAWSIHMASHHVYMFESILRKFRFFFVIFSATCMPSHFCNHVLCMFWFKNNKNSVNVSCQRVYIGMTCPSASVHCCWQPATCSIFDDILFSFTIYKSCFWINPFGMFAEVLRLLKKGKRKWLSH